jgi:hypothetical protein
MKPVLNLDGGLKTQSTLMPEIFFRFVWTFTQKKKITLTWAVNGEKTPFWAAKDPCPPVAIGKKKSVTPTSFLAHPSLRCNTFTLYGS